MKKIGVISAFTGFFVLIVLAGIVGGASRTDNADGTTRNALAADSDVTQVSGPIFSKPPRVEESVIPEELAVSGEDTISESLTPADRDLDGDLTAVAMREIQGYGSNTKAGAGGARCAVTNLNDAGAGSLRSCVNMSGPTEIIFDVGGTIVLKDTLNITKPFKSILGDTAPSPVVVTTNEHVANAVIAVNAHDVLIQHLRIRANDKYSGGYSCCHDALSIASSDAPVYNVVIHQNDIMWGADEIIDIWYAARDITVSNNVIAESMHDVGISKDGPAGRGFITGAAGSKNITIYNNLFAHSYQRNPMVSSDNVQVVNNVIYSWVSRGSHLTSRFGPMKVNMVGNKYIATKHTATQWMDIHVESAGYPMSAYLNDNIGHWRKDGDPDQWALVSSGTYMERHSDLSERASTPHNMPKLDIVKANQIEAKLKPLVGATLPSRDAVGNRVIREWVNRTGYMPNCITGCSKPANR